MVAALLIRECGDVVGATVTTAPVCGEVEPRKHGIGVDPHGERRFATVVVSSLGDVTSTVDNPAANEG